MTEKEKEALVEKIIEKMVKLGLVVLVDEPQTEE